MSKMELFYGQFRPSDLKIIPKDTDDFYDLEEKYKKQFVMVDGQLYEFEEIEKLNEYGFELVIPNQDPTGDYHRFIAYWYNGGAGRHEVVEETIRNFLKKG